MKLFRPVVYVHLQQIVQQQVLEEVVPVILLFVGNHQILNFADRDFGNHQRMLAAADRRQNVGDFIVLEYLHQIMIPDDLRVHRRARKARNRLRGRNHSAGCHCEQLTVQILHAEFHFCNRR